LTDKETAKIMAVLKAAYPRYYQDISEKEARQVVALWDTMLKNYQYETVATAVKALIATEKFAPTVAEVIDKIRLVTTPQELGEVEAWGLVKKALRNGYYNSQNEFNKLPIVIQKAIGCHETLRDWSQVEASKVETVVGSNFMRSYRAKRKAENDYSALPTDVKNFMAIATERIEKKILTVEAD